jgi:fermentation-respiration switch protein FrsA (DUF1100 family)
MILLLSVLWLSGCTHLFYHPSDIMYLDHPEAFDKLHETVTFTSSDGVKLSGWYFPARKGGHRGTVIQFHGNAQNLTSHFAAVFWMIDEGYDVFAFDYRGYGVSEGKPSPAGVNQDALAAIHYVAARKSGFLGKDLVLYGQSLGGAVLLRAMDEVPTEERARVKAVVIESSFYSYHAISRDVLSRSWISFIFQPLAYVLVSNKYSPEESISRIAPIPLLVIHGDQDPVIPYRFGQKIFELAGSPKTFIHVKGGHHIDGMGIENGRYRPMLLDFLEGRD